MITTTKIHNNNDNDNNENNDDNNNHNNDDNVDNDNDNDNAKTSKNNPLRHGTADVALRRSFLCDNTRSRINRTKILSASPLREAKDESNKAVYME